MVEEEGKLPNEPAPADNIRAACPGPFERPGRERSHAGRQSVRLVVHEISHKISESDIRDFLAANGEVRGWHPDGLRWVSGDKQLEAFRQMNHHDMFFVEDIAVVEKSPRPRSQGGR